MTGLGGRASGKRSTPAGIEIEVTPAGKATRRLSLLSGGEKALVALAFVFAVFLARPSPFYILDEVEAALDDANIDRFLQLVRRFSDRAQFVIVTHQKRTMDAADVLYGVSMGKGGITKVISRRLSQPEVAADAAEAAEGRLTRRANLPRDGAQLAGSLRPRRQQRGHLRRARRAEEPEQRGGLFQAPSRVALEEPAGPPGRAQREPVRASSTTRRGSAWRRR